MNICDYVEALVEYGIEKNLIPALDRVFIRNRILGILKISDFTPCEKPMVLYMSIADILENLCDYAVSKGQIENSVTQRDLLDTEIMGALTAPPSGIITKFAELYSEGSMAATGWFYAHAQDVNYIRRDRIAKDMQWKTSTEYGDMHITINLSKPEKDPNDIEREKQISKVEYPKCMICPENEGYVGNAAHPARQNLRMIPLELAGGIWAMQYSPYVYYNEHCIVLNQQHVPMVIDASVFNKLLDFVEMFPHYFLGSNADLPVVGGSILSHEHFQGGRYTFPLQLAELEEEFNGDFSGRISIVKWPMSVIRISHEDKAELSAYASKVLAKWKGYSDPQSHIFAEIDGVTHNTITPIARKNGEAYELDLVLRNSITTKEHPAGLFHPHGELHNIKRENIGLIEVMGLAILPGRLKKEMQALAQAVLDGNDIGQNPLIEKHEAWVKARLPKYEEITENNIEQILKTEIGLSFKTCLEHAGVFKTDDAGKAAFRKFMDEIL